MTRTAFIGVDFSTKNIAVFSKELDFQFFREHKYNFDYKLYFAILAELELQLISACDEKLEKFEKIIVYSEPAVSNSRDGFMKYSECSGMIFSTIWNSLKFEKNDICFKKINAPEIVNKLELLHFRNDEQKRLMAVALNEKGIKLILDYREQTLPQLKAICNANKIKIPTISTAQKLVYKNYAISQFSLSANLKEHQYDAACIYKAGKIKWEIAKVKT